MGVIQPPDELQLVIERQVAEGRAVDMLAFVEEAVRRSVDDTMREEDGLLRAVDAGSVDIAVGRCVAVTTGEDEERVHDGARPACARHPRSSDPAAAPTR